MLLTGADITTLAAALDLSETELIDRYTGLASNRRQLSLNEQSDGCCVFLTGQGCSVYEARPEQCRNFPHAWRVSEGCPALDAMDKSQLNR